MRHRAIEFVVGILAIALLPFARTCVAAPAFYSVAEIDGVWWFVDPQGKPFYSIGVSDIGPGPDRDKYDANRPAYAAFQHYGSNDAWAADSLRRLVEWNFNTVGSWAHPTLTRGPLPYADVLHLGSEVGFPWNDAFNKDFEVAIEKLARERVRPRRSDKNLLGWFSDNEQGWYPDTLFVYHLSQPSTSDTRRALIALLVDQYDSEFGSLKQDFELIGATTFDELGQGGELKLRPEGNGRRVVLRFAGALAKRYYQVVHNAIRSNDPNHLILGDRYAWHCPDVVAKAAAPYVDVISTNYDWPEATDGYMPAGYLRNLHRVTGKPVLITEYYVAASENRSGNKNSGGIFLTVGTQKERTNAVENRLRGLATQPYVVGAHWFRFADEPTHGRSDGEDYNFGLVDIHNRPYAELTAAMKRLHADVPRLHRESRPAIEERGHPILVPFVRAEMSKLHKQLLSARSLEAVDESLQLYELLATWRPESLHFVALVCHVSERTTHSATGVPDLHELELSIESAQMHSPVRVHFGGRSGTTASPPNVKCWLASKGLRQTLVVAIPPGLFGKDRFEAGQQLACKFSLSNLLENRTIECESQLVLGGEDAVANNQADLTRPPGKGPSLHDSSGE